MQIRYELLSGVPGFGESFGAPGELLNRTHRPVSSSAAKSPNRMQNLREQPCRHCLAACRLARSNMWCRQADRAPSSALIRGDFCRRQPLSSRFGHDTAARNSVPCRCSTDRRVESEGAGGHHRRRPAARHAGAAGSGNAWPAWARPGGYVARGAPLACPCRARGALNRRARLGRGSRAEGAGRACPCGLDSVPAGGHVKGLDGTAGGELEQNVLVATSPGSIDRSIDSCLGGPWTAWRINIPFALCHSAHELPTRARGRGAGRIIFRGGIVFWGCERCAEIRPGYGSRPTKLRITGRGRKILLQHGGPGGARASPPRPSAGRRGSCVRAFWLAATCAYGVPSCRPGHAVAARTHHWSEGRPCQPSGRWRDDARPRASVAMRGRVVS